MDVDPRGLGGSTGGEQVSFGPTPFEDAQRRLILRKLLVGISLLVVVSGISLLVHARRIWELLLAFVLIAGGGVLPCRTLRGGMVIIRGVRRVRSGTCYWCRFPVVPLKPERCPECGRDPFGP